MLKCREFPPVEQIFSPRVVSEWEGRPRDLDDPGLPRVKLRDQEFADVYELFVKVEVLGPAEVEDGKVKTRARLRCWFDERLSDCIYLSDFRHRDATDLITQTLKETKR